MAYIYQLIVKGTNEQVRGARSGRVLRVITFVPVELGCSLLTVVFTNSEILNLLVQELKKKIFFKFTYFERECVSRGGAERGGESQAGTMLSAQTLCRAETHETDIMT